MKIGQPMTVITTPVTCGRCSFVFFVTEPEKNLTAKTIPCPQCFKIGVNPNA